MKRIRINKKVVWGFYLLGIAGMGVFAFWDLAISLRLYNSSSSFGRWIEAFGDYPLFLLLGAGSAYLFLEESKKQEKAVGRLLLWAVGSLAGAMLCSVLPVYRIAGVKLWSFLLIPLFLAFFGLVAVKMPQEKQELLHQLAVFAIIYFVAAQVIAYGIKIPWGRLRFRHMTEPLVQFIPWYLPQGVTGNHSFPSGHTFNSCGVLLLLYLPGIWKKGQQPGWLFWLLCCSWIALVALGRIVAGAHFASDVTMGAMLGVGTFLVMNQRLGKQREKEDEA